MRVAAFVSLLLLATLALAPMAGADHVYSHRLVAVGRVVDVDGLPVAGAPLELEVANVPSGGPCAGSPPPVTGPGGDFYLCQHVHAFPGRVFATLHVGEDRRTLPVDPDLRLVAFHVQLDAPQESPPGGIEAWRGTYVVVGRVFERQAEPVVAEGIPVNATPRAQSPVSIAIRAGEEELATVEVRTGENGDFAVEIPIGEIPPEAEVVVETDGNRSAQPVDLVFRRNDVHVLLDAEAEAGSPGTDLAPTREQSQKVIAPPGTSSTPAGWLGLVLVALAGVALKRRSG